MNWIFTHCRLPLGDAIAECTRNRPAGIIARYQEQTAP